MLASLYEVSLVEAFKVMKRNAFSRWVGKKNVEAGQCDTMAVNRLQQTFFSPGIIPSFHISPEDRLFAMGSCFARGIEKAMSARGFDVASMADDFNHFEVVNDSVTGLGFTNKYSTYSILNEIRWALDPDAMFPDGSIVEVDGGCWVDPHTNPTLKLVGREETFHRREIITSVVSRLKDCRILFLTLGLVEVWFDNETRVFMNMAPTPAMRHRYPDRYTCHVTTYEQNMQNLEELYALLQGYGHPDVHIIVTVSPVPLMATFTERDVVLANTYSKSVLRAVAEEWAVRHNNIDYFPSYEIVMNSSRERCWCDDLRHIRGEAVEHIMDIFSAHYLADLEANRVSILDKTKRFLKRYKR